MLVKSDQIEPTTPSARIPLGDGKFALVDPERYDELNKFKWYAKKSFYRFYACRKVVRANKVSFIRMHRVLANTPPDMVCHHINGNTLDNRRANLLNMTVFDHTKMHSYR